MTQANVQRLSATSHRRDASYSPRQFNPLTQGRFIRARQAGHLARVLGEPTPAQIEMARSMAVLEWGSLLNENEGSVQSLRECREHRRLLLRVLADFERSLSSAQALPPPSRSDPTRQAITDFLKAQREAEEASAS